MKITEIGQQCRHCDGAVVERTHKEDWKPKKGQPFYFKRWLKCPKCGTLYMLESEKVRLVPKPAYRETINEMLDRAIAKDGD